MKNNFIILMSIAVVFFTSCSNDDTPSDPIEIVIEGAAIAPEVGGPNEPNQVYVDLSTNTATAVQRDSWDLGFYSGSEFKVTINGSIYMAVAALDATDIDAISSTTEEVQNLQPQVAVGTFAAANTAYVDNPNGDITATAIATIADTDDLNVVYLLNLGYEVGTEIATTGSVAISGDTRGWKKIRILKRGTDYLLQYADLDDTTHQEITIGKETTFNFTFFSFNTETVVNVEPEARKWDLNFTVFTNEIEGYGSYGYSDYVVNNTKASATVYFIDTEVDTYTYDDFTLADVNNANFLNDQRGVGSNWRNGGGPGSLPSLKDNVFFIVNDTDGNYYKLKFLAFTNEAGERGYPKFVYSLLE
tara:strand:- start:50944 stop:52023 length:1080 start_codon:yes stop_codon:yes gene_type:complete